MLKKQIIPQRRSWSTTIIAGLITLAAIAVSLLFFPLNNIGSITGFILAIAFAILGAVVAIAGQRGTLRDLFQMLFLWA